MKLLIIKTGSTLAPLLENKSGDFEDWIRAEILEVHPACAIKVCNVSQGDSLPQIDALSAVIVTGSPAMVSAQLPWSESCAAWLRRTVAAEVPTLGLCYGHQLLAHALGGKVGKNPNGREFGTVLIEQLAKDPLLGSSPSFYAHVCHTESVLELPAGAFPIARSSKDPFQSFRYGKSAWGVQFHPEFSAAISRFYLEYYRTVLNEEGQNVDTLLRGVVDTPDATALLARFVSLSASIAR